MELRHFRSFVAVAEELHFGRAAERLHIAQPALSRQIRQLERDLDVQLFTRTKRRVELTEAGRVFLPEARQTIDQAARAARAAQRSVRGEIGRLEVSFVPSATHEVLPPIFGAFHERFPDVVIVPRQMTTSEQLQALTDDKIGIGFVCLPAGADGQMLETMGNDENLVIEPLQRESLRLVIPAAHPLAAAAVVSRCDLAGEPFVLFRRDLEPSLYAGYVALCAEGGFAPNVVTDEANSTLTMVSLAAAGLGLSLIPATAQNQRRSRVVYRTMEPALPKVWIVAVWRRDDPSPTLRSFLDVVRATPRQPTAA